MDSLRLFYSFVVARKGEAVRFSLPRAEETGFFNKALIRIGMTPEKRRCRA
jgi:hypothetical protein